jgi:hypothetical protein
MAKAEAIVAPALAKIEARIAGAAARTESISTTASAKVEEPLAQLSTLRTGTGTDRITSPFRNSASVTQDAASARAAADASKEVVARIGPVNSAAPVSNTTQAQTTVDDLDDVAQAAKKVSSKMGPHGPRLSWLDYQWRRWGGPRLFRGPTGEKMKFTLHNGRLYEGDKLGLQVGTSFRTVAAGTAVAAPVIGTGVVVGGAAMGADVIGDQSILGEKLPGNNWLGRNLRLAAGYKTGENKGGDEKTNPEHNNREKPSWLVRGINFLRSLASPGGIIGMIAAYFVGKSAVKKSPILGETASNFLGSAVIAAAVGTTAVYLYDELAPPSVKATVDSVIGPFNTAKEPPKTVVVAQAPPKPAPTGPSAPGLEGPG